MNHEDAQRLLAPLADLAGPAPRDVTAWVMRDVRGLERDRGVEDERLIWRVAAMLCSAAAGVAVVAAMSVPAENPLVEFAAQSGLAAQTTPGWEAR